MGKKRAKGKSKGRAKAPPKAGIIPPAPAPPPPKREKPKIVDVMKAAVKKVTRWKPQAYNVETENGSPLCIQMDEHRVMAFTGPNVWHVPKTKEEEVKVEAVMAHSGNGYTMRKLPLVWQRKDHLNRVTWLPDKEAIKAFLEDETSEEE